MDESSERRQAHKQALTHIAQEALDRLRATVTPGAARLVGFEHRLKDDARTKEKIADRLAVEPEKVPAEVVRRIPDVIRYTYCSDRASYVSDYYETKARLEAGGYEMYFSRNFWNHPEYKGIITRWVDSDGTRFEVQFHTIESYHARHFMTHEAWERLRHPLTSRAELRELHAYQRAVASSVPVPEDAAGIPNYKKDGF